MRLFDVGDRPRSTYTVRLDGSVVDPPFVVLIVRSPTTEQVSIYGESGQPHTIARSSEGVYYADLPLAESGDWTRRWVAFDESGDPLDAVEREFHVRASNCAEPLPAVA